ncbi:MAG: hypothetical protein HY305_01070, partial [Sphingobacteriales bacterium]|nr:hypothetical protein [Sphingobacteriales bacterium]
GMANLTKELLKSLGYDAHLCWIGTNHIAYNYSTPSLSVDNHMITALFFQGKTYFLDATESYIGFDEYAERIQGREVLIEKGDKYVYTKVPVTTYLQNLDAEKSVLSISGTDLIGTVSREWKGEEKEHMFAGLNAIQKEKADEAFIKFLSRDNKNYFITDFTTSSLSDYDKPLTVQYKIKHVNAISAFNNELYIDIDYRKDYNKFVFELDDRTHDYWFGFKENTHTEVQLAIPAGYTVTALPPNVLVKNEDYEFSAVLTQTPLKLTYVKNLIIKNPHLPKSKFAQWNKDVEKLQAFYNEQIVLTKK